MTGPDRWIVAVLAAFVGLAGGCFETNTRTDSGGRSRDGSVPADGPSIDGSPMGDAGMCERLGTTRLCDPYCAAECPRGESWCSEFFFVCQRTVEDPRGPERCIVDLRFGRPYCYLGGLCVAQLEPEPDGITWSGACVSEQYCRWVQEQEGLEHLRCRYTDGLLFEDGPPDHECAEGALPQNPFCGGACGDTCPADVFGDPPSCVGRSETRGFGVCLTNGYHRCGPGNPSSPENPFTQCRAAIQFLGAAPEDQVCVCMMLSPVLMDEYADHGWAVSERTCLAYQARYPGEVRCVDESEL